MDTMLSSGSQLLHDGNTIFVNKVFDDLLIFAIVFSDLIRGFDLLWSLYLSPKRILELIFDI